jgi:hypothetical protein
VKSIRGKVIPLNSQGERVIDYNEIVAHFIARQVTSTHLSSWPEIISHFRIMSAIEALCRIYQVPVVGLSHTVIPLYFHGPNEEPDITFTEGEEDEARDLAERLAGTERRSMLTAYFNKCADRNETRSWLNIRSKKQGKAATDLRFDEFPLYYIWKKVSVSLNDLRLNPQL